MYLHDVMEWQLTCAGNTQFTVSDPVESGTNLRQWLFVKTEYSLSIYCNGVQMVKIEFGDGTECADLWGGDVVGAILFEGNTQVTEVLMPTETLEPGERGRGW